MPPIYLMAGVFDLLSLIPLPIAGLLGGIVMTIVWLLHGITPWGKKYWLWYLVTWLIEFIPLVSAIPMFLLAATRMIAISRAEDMLGGNAKSNEKKKEFVRRALVRSSIKDKIKAGQQKAIWQAGAQRDKKGNITGYDAEKMQKKTDSIQKKEAALNNSLTSQKGMINRQPGFRQKQQEGGAGSASGSSDPNLEGKESPEIQNG